MPAKPLNQTQIEDAQRLKSIFKQRQRDDKGLTQESLAHACGWANQSAAAAYINGKIPLNFDALIKLSEALSVSVDEISPSLAFRLLQARLGAAAHSMDFSAEAMKVAAAYDSLDANQKQALLTILKSYGIDMKVAGHDATTYSKPIAEERTRSVPIVPRNVKQTFGSS